MSFVQSHIPEPVSLALLYRQRMGRLPNFFAPRRFSEKVQLAKLTWRTPRMVELSDKVLAKNYVAKRLGAEWVTPTWFAGPRLPPAAERDWCPPYVVKVNQGSGGNIFVNEPGDARWDTIEPQIDSWLSSPHGGALHEWAYSQIRPQVLVEPFIGIGGVTPVDYKFFVFGGRVAFIQVHTERFTEHRATFYDRQWVSAPFGLKWPIDTRPQDRPRSLSAMMKAAEELASGFQFIRIDFYEINGRPRFGEFTFYPDSGLEHFSPPEWDERLGTLWPAGRPTLGRT